MRKCNSIGTSYTSKARKALLLSSAAVMAGAAFAPMHAMADPASVDPNADWDHLNVERGSATVLDTGIGTTTITQNSATAVLTGDKIDVGVNAVITLDQPTVDALLAVFDIGDNVDPTYVLGKIFGNGSVLIGDRNGVWVGKDAVIDVQKITLTTGSVSFDDIMDGGQMDIINSSADGGIIINGQITVAEAGLAAFVSPFVTNNGVINAKMGSVQIGAGETVTLDLYGDGLLELAVDGELSDALITNNGEINAEGGLVKITAKAAKGTVDNIINNTGIITASSATVDGGKIILDGGDKGTIKNAGKVEGGFVDITGERFVQKEKLVTPLVPVPPVKPEIQSNGNDINIAVSGDVIIRDGEINAQGGDITIDNGGTFTSIAEAIKTSRTGTITLTQNDGGEIQNAIDALDNTGTGTNTINVGAGIFAETVHIDEDNTTLNGANAGISYDGARGFETVIKPDADSVGVYITADNVTLDGVLVEGGASGVLVNGADLTLIENNIIRNQYHFSGFGDSEGEYALGDGVFVQNARGTTVDNNFIGGMNDDGIEAVDVANFTASNNFIMDDGVTGDEGVAIARASENITISDNQIIGARRDGIQFLDITGEEFTRIQAYKNYIVYANSVGISLNNVDVGTKRNRYVDIYSNDIAFSNVGIDVYNSKHINIGDMGFLGPSVRGTISNAETGVKITSSDVELMNIYMSDVRNGILSDDSSILMKQNVIYAFERGVYVTGSLESKGISLYDNHIYSGKEGFFIEGDIINSDVLSKRDEIISGGDAFRVEGVLDHGRIEVAGDTLESGGNAISISNKDATKDSIAYIQSNKINYALGDSISVNGVSDIDISYNTIEASGGYGIKVENFISSDMRSNKISSSGYAGIEAAIGVGASFKDNEIYGSSSHGIDVNFVDRVSASENTVVLSGGNGLNVNYADSVYARYNTIARSGQDGIKLTNVKSVDVKNNDISNAFIGIKVSHSGDMIVENNKIFDVLTGIDVNYTDVTITNNDITSFGSGIHFDGSLHNAAIRNNVISSGADGISFDMDAVGFLKRIFINGNYILTGGNGVSVMFPEKNLGFSSWYIQDNSILANGNGLNLNLGGNEANPYVDFVIQNNEIVEAGLDGVHIEGYLGSARYFDISENKIGAKDDAIYIHNQGVGGKFTINNNQIHSFGKGIHFDGGLDGGKVVVIENTIKAGEEGVLLDGGLWNGADWEKDQEDIKVIGNSFVTVGDAIRIEGDLDKGTISIDSNDIYLGRTGVNIQNENGSGDIVASITNNKIDYTKHNAIQTNGINYVNILGNYIRNSSSALKVNDFVNLTISGNIIDTTRQFGIFVERGNSADISGNIIYNTEYESLVLSNADYAGLHGNFIYDIDANAIKVANSTLVEISDNTISNSNGIGIYVHTISGGEASILNNTLSETGHAIYLSNLDTVNVSGNNIQDVSGFGVHLNNIGLNAKVRDNKISHTGYSGVHVINGFDSYTQISNNEISFVDSSSSYAAGIEVQASSGVEILDNSIHDVDIGVDISNTTDVSIMGNEINNANDGIFLVGTSARINENEIHAFNRGVKIFGGVNGNDVRIDDNAIHSGDDGILLLGGMLNNSTFAISNNNIISGGHGVAIGNLKSSNNIGDSLVSISGNYIVSESDGVLIEGNIISGDIFIFRNKKIESGDDAIHVEGDLTDVHMIIENNGDLRSLHDDGIEIIDTGDSYAGSVRVSGNTTYDNYDDGIHIKGVRNASIIDNTVYFYDSLKDLMPSKYYYRSGDGIHIENSDGSYANSNTIHGTVAHGIHVENSEEVSLSKNDITLSGWDGIHVSGGSSVRMHNNNIGSSGGDGIEIFESDQAFLNSNKILDSGEQGVRISKSENVWIRSNEIYGSSYNGVRLDTVRATRVEDNYIVYSENAGVSASNSINTLKINDNAIGFSDYGVEVTDSWSAAIADNFIHNVETGIKTDTISSSNTIARNEILNARNGMELSNTRATIDSNIIDVFETGIHFDGSLDGGKVVVTGNTIEAGEEGVLIDSDDIFDSVLTNGVEITISDNSILSGEEGILIQGNLDTGVVSIWSNDIDSGKSSISMFNNRGDGEVAVSVGYNRLISSGGSAINIHDVDDVEVIHNTIEYAKNFGINVRDFFNTLISGNVVNGAQYSGITAWEGAVSDISNNTVYKSGSIGGIQVAYNDFSIISGNVVEFSGRYVDAIGSGNGIAGFGNGFLAITNNEVNNSRGKGITGNGSNYTIIDNNIVKNSGSTGVSANGHKSPIEITNNIISNSRYSGVNVFAFNNGDILFEGNTLTNNGGSTAPQVSFESGTIDLGDVNNPNTIINTTSHPSTAIEFKFEFDSHIIENNVHLANNTIGATIFEGYKHEDSNYIRIGDGSLINPDTNLPYVIDGTEASFDGVVPSSFTDGELPLSTLTFIEDRIFDADDVVVDGRGQIFVGTAQN